MSGKAEFIKKLIDELTNESYEEGWNDCKESMTSQQLQEDRYIELESKFKIQKQRLVLAIKLLRYAQRTPCGADGQFDRFFEEVPENELIDVYV